MRIPGLAPSLIRMLMLMPMRCSRGAIAAPCGCICKMPGGSSPPDRGLDPCADATHGQPRAGLRRLLHLRHQRSSRLTMSPARRAPRAAQEMLLHLGINDMPTDLRVRIQSTLIDLLQQPTPESHGDWGEVPLPTDERVRALVQAVLDDPGDARSANELFLAHGLH